MVLISLRGPRCQAWPSKNIWYDNLDFFTLYCNTETHSHTLNMDIICCSRDAPICRKEDPSACTEKESERRRFTWGKSFMVVTGEWRNSISRAGFAQRCFSRVDVCCHMVFEAVSWRWSTDFSSHYATVQPFSSCMSLKKHLISFSLSNMHFWKCTMTSEWVSWTLRLRNIPPRREDKSAKEHASAALNFLPRRKQTDERFSN